MWYAIERLFEWLRTLPLVGFSLLGCGFARAWLGWLLDLVCNSGSIPEVTPFVGHLLFDLGEIAGFFLLSSFVLKKGPLRGRSWVLTVALVATMLSSLAVLLMISLGIPGVVILTLVVAGGFGYAFLLMLWLELYGCLSPRRMLVAWSGSYLLATLIWLVWSNMTTMSSSVVLMLFPLISVVMLVRGFYAIPPERMPLAEVTSAHLALAPWRYVASVTGFVLAIGVMDIITAREIYSEVSRLGMILVELAVLIGVLLFPTKFELKSVLTLLPVVVLLGTVAAFVSRGNGDLSHLFLVAGSECCLVVSYMVGCALAYRLRRSAVVLCGIFAGLNKVFLQIGKAVSTGIIGMLGGTALTHCLLFSAVILITIVATAILVKNSDLVDRLSWEPRTSGGPESVLSTVVRLYGLTSREASVLGLLAEGKTTAEIADELFCAQSTVRAHMSNASKKLGVHSREELVSRITEG